VHDLKETLVFSGHPTSCREMQRVAVYCRVLQYAAVCCSVLQYVAVCCSMLQCVAVCCSVWHNLLGGPVLLGCPATCGATILPPPIPVIPDIIISRKVSITFILHSKLSSKQTFQKFQHQCPCPLQHLFYSQKSACCSNDYTNWLDSLLLRLLPPMPMPIEAPIPDAPIPCVCMCAKRLVHKCGMPHPCV